MITFNAIQKEIFNLNPAAKNIFNFLVGYQNTKSKDTLKLVIKKFSAEWCSQYISKMTDIMCLGENERNKQVLNKLFTDRSLSIELYMTFMEVESKKNTPWFMKLPLVKGWTQEFSLNYLGLDGKSCISQIKKGNITSKDVDSAVFLAGLYLCHQEWTQDL
jgi:hypothetical protein